MEVDKSTQGTLEDQMFFNRKTLQEITQMRHENPTNQVLHEFHNFLFLDCQISLCCLKFLHDIYIAGFRFYIKGHN